MSAKPENELRAAWQAKAALLRARGQKNTLHDINQAADYLDAASDVIAQRESQGAEPVAWPNDRPPPHWTPDDKYDRHPKTADAWDWRADGSGDERWDRQIRRLNFAGDMADPRAPDQMALVLRKDLIDIKHRLLRQTALAGLYKRKNEEAAEAQARVEALEAALEQTASAVVKMNRDTVTAFQQGEAVAKDCARIWEAVGMSNDGDGWGFADSDWTDPADLGLRSLAKRLIAHYDTPYDGSLVGGSAHAAEFMEIIDAFRALLSPSTPKPERVEITERYSDAIDASRRIHDWVNATADRDGKVVSREIRTYTFNEDDGGAVLYFRNNKVAAGGFMVRDLHNFTVSMKVFAAEEVRWPEDGSCRECSAVPRSPSTGLCATCEDEVAAALTPSPSNAGEA